MIQNDYFLQRLMQDRFSDLQRSSAEVRINRFLERIGGRPRPVAWVGLKLARIGARLAGVRITIPRTVRELEQITCAGC